MKRIFFLKTLFLCLILQKLEAQSFHFEKKFDIVVNDSLGNPIKQPWIGGLNATIMGEIDLNFDGKMDLIVYDQHAEKILTFLNFGVGKNGLNDYRYAPQYEKKFPNIAPVMNKLMWFQLVDFNGDGLPDLLVSNGNGGVTVYKNVSRNSTVEFELYIERLQYQLENSQYRPLVFSMHASPHFVDIDGDGDLDLLVFGGMNGTTLFYYKNRSLEHFERKDTFDFILENEMWGCFREGYVSNEIILNTCEEVRGARYEVRGSFAKSQPSNQDTTSHPAPRTLQPKHGEGSTIFAIDLNGDSLYDLLLADGGYPNTTALFSSGTPEDAKITSFHTAFPKQSTPVNLPNTPVVSAIDVDNCGVKELIFSPFNAKDFSTESYASNWIYKNMSPFGKADFQLISQRFLQDEMLDFGMGTFPTIVDIDGDGLLDIVVGTYGNIDSVWDNGGTWESRFVADLVLLKNIGTPTEPMFQIHPLNITPKIDFSGAVPTFGDIDGDGRLDLLIGTENGQIRWYKMEQGDASAEFNFVLESENILKKNIGFFLAPQLFDINNDGLLDLVVGSQRTIWYNAQGQPYSKSSITCLENTGTRESPYFTMITDSLGRVDVTNREWSVNGYSKPHFFRDISGNTHLFCGNEDGKILHYTDIDDNLFDGGTFRRLDDVEFWMNNTVGAQHAVPLHEGSFTAVATADLNNDGLLDMVVGNHRGGLTIFFGISEIPVKNKPEIIEPNIAIYPNPVQDFLFIQSEQGYRMQCEILDLQGRIIRPLQTVLDDQPIDFRGFPTGIYMLKLVVESQILSRKIIKVQ